MGNLSNDLNHADTDKKIGLVDAHEKIIAESIKRHIKTSRKQVTVLFTDIEYSTLLWDIRGDIEGRLMVDKHNRLLFPVIRAHRGRVLKTIGDAIMASFKTPEDAVRAAIGIQQILDHARRRYDNFQIRVRIGMHTGMAIVEQNDVFGDVVNTASRIENEAKRNEIFLSEETMAGLENQGYFFAEEGSLYFKGKREPINVYRCEWRHCKSMIADVRFDALLPVGPRQKFDFLIYAIAIFAVLYFLYYNYVRYFLADLEAESQFSLNPLVFASDHPWVLIILAAMVVYSGILVSRLKRIPHIALRLMKGGFGFCLGLFGFYLPSLYLPDPIIEGLNQTLYQSKTQFVEILQDTVAYDRASANARVVAPVDSGGVRLSLAQAPFRGAIWHQVLISTGRTGWIPQSLPARFGVPALEVARSGAFRFTFRDMYSLMIGGLIFIWGTLNFRIRPT